MERNHTYTAQIVIAEYMPREKFEYLGNPQAQKPNAAGLYHAAYVESFKSGERDIAYFFKTHPNIDFAIYVKTLKQAREIAREWQDRFNQTNG